MSLQRRPVQSEQDTVPRLRLTAARAEKVIHQSAQDAGNVVLGEHALERMSERGIFTTDVLRILRTGWVDDEPERTDYGEWKCKMTLDINRGRTAGVVTIIMQNDMLFVKTVEWEDI
jgi:hypothetical protein